LNFIFVAKTLYYKYPLDEDWSIRYHILFKDRKMYQNRWVLKSHFTKEYIFLSTKDAKSYIEKYNSAPKLIMGFIHKEDYRKVEINNIGDLHYYLDNKDQPPE